MIASEAWVSVCIPVYNGAAFLAETIASVCTQAYPNVEIVATVDRSDDGSWEILEAARDRFPHREFVIERNPARLGMAGNWNRSIDFATGDFIKVMGQDDILEPDCLSKQLRFLDEHPECNLVASACRIVRHDGRPVLTRCRFPNGTVLDKDDLLNRCLHTSANLIGEPVTVLTRASAFEGVRFDPAFAYYTDLELWLRIIGGQSVGFIGEPLCSFRVHRSACSWGQQGRAYEEFLQLESLYSEVALKSPIARSVRWLRGQALIFARTSFYRIFG
jgi:glycosyltransferase involved in cell wall biosynthesis